MGKSRRGSKEVTREQRLIRENQSLKRELGRIRKEFARLDLDRYETVKEAVDDHAERSGIPSTKDLLSAMRKEWACKMPGCGGALEITLYTKVGQTHYYRQCDSCTNRTVAKKYTPSVKGIMRNKEQNEPN